MQTKFTVIMHEEEFPIVDDPHRLRIGQLVRHRIRGDGYVASISLDITISKRFVVFYPSEAWVPLVAALKCAVGLGTFSDLSEARLKEMFDELDADKNGSLDQRELATALRSLGLHPEDIDAMLRAMPKERLEFADFKRVIAPSANALESANESGLFIRWSKAREKLRRFVRHASTANFVMLCIVVNTIVLASDFYDHGFYTANYRTLFAQNCEAELAQVRAILKGDSADCRSIDLSSDRDLFVARLTIREQLTNCTAACSKLVSGNTDVLGMPLVWGDAQSILNGVLTSIFACEMVLKMLGEGFWAYARDPFNVFDGSIVAASVLELVISAIAESAAGSSMSALRALRLVCPFSPHVVYSSVRALISACSFESCVRSRWPENGSRCETS